jgi:hypothetical protein
MDPSFVRDGGEDAGEGEPEQLVALGVRERSTAERIIRLGHPASLDRGADGGRTVVVGGRP